MAKRGRKGKDNWKKKRRQEYLEKKEFRYYIFCEGQATEPKYFQGFKRYIEDNPIYRDMVLIEIEGCQAETMRVIGKAEEYVRENKITKGQIWCVYDKDSFPSSDVNGVVQRAEVLNQKNPDVQYHAAWSNECIEFWFMLHFAYYTANNHRSEYKKFLNEKFQELGIGKYEKNMDDIFETLMNGGNPKLAIRYAKRIIENGKGKTPAEIAPGTKVYELVEELAKYLPEELKGKFAWAVEIAYYIIENKATVRQTAKKFGMSKSTIHKDVTERLLQINPALAGEARKVLDQNKSERHIRGGLATKEKYLHQHMLRQH